MPPFCFFYTHFYPVVPALLKHCCAGLDQGFLFICHRYKAIDEKITETAALKMDSKVAVFFFFQGQYLPSLNTNCLTIDKDMKKKRLPQLYYTKMKNCCKQCYILSAPVHDCGKNSRCREILLQGKQIMTSFRCYDDSYVNITTM